MSDTTLLEAIRRWEPPSAPELAAQIPGVTVERLIARGGMAAVYLAHQQSLDRAVALKVLPPELGCIEGFNERFESEARVLARLHHPGIVTVFDFGRTPAGSAYIVMELVSGESLTTWGRGKALAEKLPVALRLIEGVAYLHRQGVVHADIKPDNVLVEVDGQVRILDFGLATPFRSVGEIETPRFGTPPYTAPEAYRADARPDPRSDLYSLGQTLCEFFAERPPPVQPDPAELATHLGNRDLAMAIWPMIRPRPEDRPASLDGIPMKFQQATSQPRSQPHPGPASRPRPSSASVAAGKARGNTWKYVASMLVVVVGAIALRQWQSSNTASSPTRQPTSASPPVAADPTQPAEPPASVGEADAIFREATAAESAAPTTQPIPKPIAKTDPPAQLEPAAAIPQGGQPASAPANPKVRELNEKFIAALAREREKAEAGDPKTAAAYQAEMDRINNHQSVPATDPPDLPEALQRLRAIYRAQMAKALSSIPSVASSPPATAAERATSPPALAYAPFDDVPAEKPRASMPAVDPAKPKARITLFWRCADKSEFLLNGDPAEAESARGAQYGPKVWKAEVDIAEGDVLGFKLSSNGGERDFAALAKVGGRLLFVTDAKWQIIDGEPSKDWWTGVDKRGTEPRKLNSKEYNNRLVQDFCSFTEVPRGNILACWGGDAARSNIRRVITRFDVQTAMGAGVK